MIPCASAPASAPATRPSGFVTVDLDGLWALRTCYQQPVGESFRRDPVWEEGLPWLLEELEHRKIRATFFIVARDLEVESKRELARELVRRGHEIGNHSLRHGIGLTRLPMGDLLEELGAAQHLFEETLGVRPAGFRSPGYDVDARLLRAVRRVGFRYDSSMLPSPWGPLLRLADWIVARRVRPRRRQFGRVGYALAPLGPYHPDPHCARRATAAATLPPAADSPPKFWEIPISVTPRLRLPLAAGYVMLGGRAYFRRALRDLSRRGVPVCALIHGADVTDLRRGGVRVFPSRRRQPRAGGFALDIRAKRAVLRDMLDDLAQSLSLYRLGDWPVQSG